jgi:hypothetical protein
MIPEPSRRGSCTIAMAVRARVTVEPGSRPTVIAAANQYTTELEVLLVRHRAS